MKRLFIGSYKKEPGIPFSEDGKRFIVGINFNFKRVWNLVLFGFEF
jgi:hypothetical protein